MTKFEFDCVMKVMNINNFYNYLIYYDNGSVKIRGKIPYYFGEYLENKYELYKYGIVIDNGSLVIEEAIDDLYDENDEYGREKLILRKNKNKYNKCYSISSRNGLVLFLLEMNEFEKNKRNTDKCNIDLGKKIDEIDNYLIDKSNLYISNKEWLKGDRKFINSFNSGNEIDRRIRYMVNEFDRAILTNIKSSNFSVEPYDSKIMKRKNCIKLSYEDSLNKLYYYRTGEGFSYQMVCEIGLNRYLYFSHYYTKRGFNDNRGEILELMYYGDNMKYKKDLLYNLTNCTIGSKYEYKVKANKKQKEYIYSEIKNANKCLSLIKDGKELKYKA